MQVVHRTKKSYKVNCVQITFKTVLKFTVSSHASKSHENGCIGDKTPFPTEGTTHIYFHISFINFLPLMLKSSAKNNTSGNL